MPYPTIPLEQRHPDDIVTRFGERFRRGELDRAISEPDLFFSMLGNGEPGYQTGIHPENTPSYVATEIARTAGRVALADIGCGTGNTLFTWGRKVAEDAPCELDQVSMTGLSLRDYSQESASAATLDAHASLRHIFQYTTGDAARMPEIAPDSQDVVLAYNSLIYARNPARWLHEMARITRPGGTIFFNAWFHQGAAGRPLSDGLDVLEANGWQSLVNNLLLRKPPSAGILADGRQRKVIGSTTVYRLDAPQT